MGIGEQFEFEKTGRIDPEPTCSEVAGLTEIEVKSSNVKSVRWDEEKNLYVRFSDSSVYRYFGVEKVLYLELVQAESIGKFINRYIKGQFPCKKVEG